MTPPPNEKPALLDRAFIGIPMGALLSSLCQGLAYLALLGLGILLGNAQYGMAMFLGAPLVVSFFGALLARKLRCRHKIDAYSAAFLGLAFGMVFLLGAALEGFICILMASPLSIFSAWLGCIAGTSMTKPWVSGLVCGAATLGMGAADRDLQKDFAAGRLTRRTVGVVRGSPEQVWPHVVQQGQLAPPSFWMFRAGVAHPVHTSAASEEVGARRVCQLSTGLVDETITESVPGRVFEFEAHSTPPSMKELNPFHAHVHAGHLESYFTLQRGRFELRPLPGGRTEITCTTWYTNRYAPLGYWRMWSDMLVSQVHLQVLTEIDRRTAAENGE